jgi:hypothetical protein
MCCYPYVVLASQSQQGGLTQDQLYEKGLTYNSLCGYPDVVFASQS